MMIEPFFVVDVVDVTMPFCSTVPATIVTFPCGAEIDPLLTTLPGVVEE